MRLLFLASFLASSLASSLLGGCGDDSGSGPIDGASGDGANGGDGAGGTPDGGRDGAAIDAALPPSCGGLTKEVCEATSGCAPACVSICDCSCPGPPGGHEGCGCAGCPATCFTYDECVATYGFTPCGEDWCDPAEDVCVTRTGGIGIFSSCEKVPDGCLDDRTCGCLGADLCEAPYTACTVDAEANTVSCDCPTCA